MVRQWSEELWFGNIVNRTNVCQKSLATKFYRTSLCAILWWIVVRCHKDQHCKSYRIGTKTRFHQLIIFASVPSWMPSGCHGNAEQIMIQFNQVNEGKLVELKTEQSPKCMACCELQFVN